jgi:hypothetical protein
MRLQHRAGRRSGKGRGTRPGTERTASASAQAAPPRLRVSGRGVLKNGGTGLAPQLLRLRAVCPSRSRRSSRR